MCGICGYLVMDRDRPVAPEVVEDMCAVLAHRGPDDQGIFVDGPIGLGQRRLSIIDVEGGHQPMCNEDGTVWITYNGEVYNFQALREGLERSGHRFETRCDTEVLVHLYEEEGPDFLERLNGMFALAVWDKRRERLLLARDRMGQKPLYWGVFDRTLIFASELKGILAHPKARRELDLDTLSRYLAMEFVPAPHAIFQDINKLIPAGRAVIERGRIHLDTFWEYPLGKGKLDLCLQEAETRLRELLQRSVERRLISDVPLGVFLSGGIDSSTVAALMCHSAVPEVKTFSIGFCEEKEDESPYARTVARYLGTDHHERVLSPQAALDLIPRLGRLLDEPLADPSLVPTYLLSSFTREHVTVALGGDGGDELVAGYGEYLSPHYPGVYRKLPGFVREALLKPVMRRVPATVRMLKHISRAEARLLGLGQEGGVRHHDWRGGLNPLEQELLFTPESWEQVSHGVAYDQVRSYERSCVATDPIERLLFLDAKLLMQDCILVKVDRASMAVGLEARAPFLDPEVVEFLAALPLDYKLRGLTTKYLLKRAMRGILPREIIERPKQGFAVPLREWFRGEFRALIEEMFAARRLRRAGLFRPKYVRRLLEEHRSGLRDHQRVLWLLLTFELWYEHYCLSARPAAV